MTEAVYRTIRPHLGATSAVVRFNVPRDILSEQTTHTVLRIVRELVVNAIRHGLATHVRIAGTLKDGVIMFSVKDNGSGFCATTANGPSNGHFGLQGIRERLLNYNGSMSVENSPDGGADFRIVMNDNITEDT
jgi:signal transduction histidine kinase